MKNLLASILFLSILGCSTTDKQETTADFDQLTDDYLQVFWGLSPGWASWAGLSQYDSVLVVPTPSYLEEVKSTTDSLLVVLNSYPEETLEDLDKIDLNMMKDMLNSAIWSMTEFMSREWDPSETNIAFRVGMIMNRPDSMDIKLKTLNALLTNAPEFYRVRLANVKTPSKPHLDLAILQNQGTLNYLSSLEGTVESAEISSDQKEELTSKIKNTKAAVEEFINGLQAFVETENFKDSRIGKELFEQKYKHEINSEYSAKEIYELAQAEKARLHAQMIVISDTLWSSYLPEDSKPADSLVMVKMLIDKIAENHVERDSFFIEINRQVKELAAFVDEKDLLTQDPSKPLQVRETPEYMRGIAGASITPPGPYEEDGITYYNVTPLDDYTDEQAESYLREYNDYILQILNIHEAIPGHYTQLVYSNKSKSLIKSILGNGAMIEGWANYTEIMMLEEGYNNSPEMWLMRNKWHLRGVTNTILDYSYHVLDLTQEEAMSLMLDGAFQEQAEAEEKWIRLTRSSVQLSSYFTGFTQIYSLREEIKAKQKEDFDLKAFHEEFLSYGSAPVKYIREFMLKN
ncbi:MAG: DUF885 domain-containing protein [Flammeovirgaceae bacterium]|nr:DUF885 domain-containing protein [Flammeovirgaceae bacterium]|tara:strand:+ start:5611 stop:7332 length:1722 start_codon:yes stop_codon:yes gene_type:complete